MALTLEGVRRVIERTRWDTRKPGVAEAMRSFIKHLQALGNPDLQFVAISGLDTADKVCADVAASLYAVFLAKPAASTTNAWVKASDSASAAGANGDLVVMLRSTVGAKQFCLVFHDGLPFGTGITFGSHTTNNGSTKSAVADAATGFAIVGS